MECLHTTTRVVVVWDHFNENYGFFLIFLLTNIGVVVEEWI